MVCVERFELGCLSLSKASTLALDLVRIKHDCNATHVLIVACLIIHDLASCYLHADSKVGMVIPTSGRRPVLKHRVKNRCNELVFLLIAPLINMGFYRKAGFRPFSDNIAIAVDLATTGHYFAFN